VIPKGKFDGYLSVKIDSAKFLADPKAVTGEYVLPMRILKTPGVVDTIVEAKSFIRISLSYFAKQFGNYQYEGVFDKYMGVVLYYSSTYKFITSNGTNVRYFETVDPTTFRMVGDPKNSQDPANEVSFLIRLPFNSTVVEILPDPDAPSDIHANGDCYYDPVNRKFYLNYAWTDEEGADCFVVEELAYRNRIYDDQGGGIRINEWW
jgi:hypothetical protein